MNFDPERRRERGPNLAGVWRVAVGLFGAILGLWSGGVARAEPAGPPEDEVLSATMSLERDRLEGSEERVENGPSRRNVGPGVSRPDEPLGAWHFDLPIPLVKQLGTKTNCGPTAAAMALGAYELGASDESHRAMRDLVGEWTWQTFPLRQMQLSGYDPGMTTRDMMESALDRFGGGNDWSPVEHRWLPLEAWSVIATKQALSERRPMVILAEARLLWGIDVPGLHWVVVRGVDSGHVAFNDPGDGAIGRIPLARFWRAWRLPDVYRSLPMVAGFEGLVAHRPLPVVHVPHPSVAADALPPW